MSDPKGIIGLGVFLTVVIAGASFLGFSAAGQIKRQNAEDAALLSHGCVRANTIDDAGLPPYVYHCWTKGGREYSSWAPFPKAIPGVTRAEQGSRP